MVPPKASPQIFGFFGSDEEKVLTKASECFQNILSERNDFNQETFDGRVSRSEEVLEVCSQVIESLQTLPFLGEKVIWLKDISFLGEDIRVSQTEAAQKGVENLIEFLQKGLPKGIFLLLSASAIDKRRSFFKKIQNLAEFQFFETPTLSQVQDYETVANMIAIEAKNFSLSFKKDALQIFSFFVGNNFRLVRGELEKISLYLGEKSEVSVETVQLLVAPSDFGILWRINECLESQNLSEAISLIRTRLSFGESAIGISRATLIPVVRRLFLAKVLMAYRPLPLESYASFATALEEVKDSLQLGIKRKKDGKLQAYPLFLASKSARIFSSQKLKEMLFAALEMDFSLVTGKLEAETALYQFLSQCRVEKGLLA